MLSFEQAREQVLLHARRVASESVSLETALGRVLAQDVYAQADSPPFDNSAMDGYAGKCSDFCGEGPWTLPVLGESRAGVPAATLATGSLCRVFTGAVIPKGADCVIMQENVERDGAQARVTQAPTLGEHIRPRGSDLAKGKLALVQGTWVTPFTASLLAALDLPHLEVSRRPRVAVISTGDELRRPGSPATQGSIPESNSIAIRGLVQQVGAELVSSVIVGDDLTTTQAALSVALKEADLVVSIGGVSVGDHDVVKSAMDAAGVSLSFWKVRIKPGKPLVMGKHENAVVMGLPGNPVSAQITFSLFGLPLLRAMAGASTTAPKTYQAALSAPLFHKAGRLGFYRGHLDGSVFAPADNQSSGAVQSMAHANALALAPEDGDSIPAGSVVEVLRLAEL